MIIRECNKCKIRWEGTKDYNNWINAKVLVKPFSKDIFGMYNKFTFIHLDCGGEIIIKSDGKQEVV
jgi:hypothetical protein